MCMMLTSYEPIRGHNNVNQEGNNASPVKNRVQTTKKHHPVGLLKW